MAAMPWCIKLTCIQRTAKSKLKVTFYEGRHGAIPLMLLRLRSTSRSYSVSNASAMGLG